MFFPQVLYFAGMQQVDPGGIIGYWPVVRTTGSWYKRVPSPGRGVVKPTPYVVHTPEPALSHRFRYEKSRAADPTSMARQLTRVPWWNHPHRGRNFREEYLELLRRSGVEFDERYL